MTSSAPRRWPSTERSLRTTGRRLPTLARLIELAKRWDEPSRLAYVGLVAIGAYVMALGWAMEHRDYDEWGAFAVFPVLVTVSLPILWRITRDDERPIPGILGFGVVAKLLASLARYYVVFAVYEGNADASTYHEAGIQIRHSFHSDAISIFGLIPHAEGTDFLKQLTGLLYTVMGPTVLGGFLVFSWMGFWGLIFTYRAVLIAFPEADSPSLRQVPLLPPVVAVLALQPREGIMADVHPRHHLLRRGRASHGPTVRPAADPTGMRLDGDGSPSRGRRSHRVVGYRLHLPIQSHR